MIFFFGFSSLWAYFHRVFLGFHTFSRILTFSLSFLSPRVDFFGFSLFFFHFPHFPLPFLPLSTWRMISHTTTCLLEVPALPFAVEVEEPIADEVDSAVEDIAADFKAGEVFPPRLELELLPLRLRPFDSATYHPRIHAMAPGRILQFKDFVGGMLEDVLLRERTSHLSYDAVEVQTCSHALYLFCHSITAFYYFISFCYTDACYTTDVFFLCQYRVMPALGVDMGR